MDSQKMLQAVVDRLRGFAASKHKTTVLIVLGLAGIGLIFLSELWEKPKTQAVQQSLSEGSNAQYIAEEERRLTELVGSVAGVGRVKVMLTLEQGPRTLYAQEGRTERQSTEDVQAAGQRRVETRNNTEQKYILVESGGQKQPLVTAQLEPEIKGVVVVCEGADDIQVQTRVTHVVTTALGISSAKVCVEKIEK